MSVQAMRAAGGHLVHLVEEGETRALCGFEPSGRRGRWYRSSVPTYPTRWKRACPKCQEAQCGES